MKDYKQQYYIQNIPWQRKLKNNILTFKDIKYNDIIIFHYDFMTSVFKVSDKYNKKVFVSAINACLRYYKIIKKYYPYNKVYMIIHIKQSLKISIDYDTFKSIIDIIPNLAICNDLSQLSDFNSQNYKHIVYGNIYNIRCILKDSSIQNWSVINGELIVRSSIV